MTTHTTHALSAKGTRLFLDDEPFYLQGLSFFNALYNPTFNRNDVERRRWLETFRANGITMLRVWCQWDFPPERTFIDIAPAHTLFTEEGDMCAGHFHTLRQVLAALDELGMVMELTLFSHEHVPYQSADVRDRSVRLLTEQLIPYRNVILQIWNEEDADVLRHVQVVRESDPTRLVSSSHGVANVLGTTEQNSVLDLLTPHTVRRTERAFWEAAAEQVAALLEQFGKPVIDDEPARTGILQYGGISGGTSPKQHIEQIRLVRALGGYHIYHHDMFQRPYGDPATPASGIPDPDFSPFHRQVFDYLRDHPTW